MQSISRTLAIMATAAIALKLQPANTSSPTHHAEGHHTIHGDNQHGHEAGEHLAKHDVINNALAQVQSVDDITSEENTELRELWDIYDDKNDNRMKQAKWEELLADFGVTSDDFDLDGIWYDVATGDQTVINYNQFKFSLIALEAEIEEKGMDISLFESMITPYTPSSEELDELYRVWTTMSTDGSMSKTKWVNVLKGFDVDLLMRLDDDPEDLGPAALEIYKVCHMLFSCSAKEKIKWTLELVYEEQFSSGSIDYPEFLQSLEYISENYDPHRSGYVYK